MSRGDDDDDDGDGGNDVDSIHSNTLDLDLAVWLGRLLGPLVVVVVVLLVVAQRNNCGTHNSPPN